jgi:hypothetical protein
MSGVPGMPGVLRVTKLAIFDTMASAIKIRFYFLMIFTVMLLMAEFISVDRIPDNITDIDCECPDFSMHSDHSHVHFFGDEVLYGITISDFLRSEGLQNSISFRDIIFADNYFSKIWQPPKNS